MLDRGRKEEQGSYLSRACFVPGPLLYMLSYLNHTEPGQMHKLRLRELQKLGHGPTASKEQSRDSVPSLFPPDILAWDTEISTPPPPTFLSSFAILFQITSCSHARKWNKITADRNGSKRPSQLWKTPAGLPSVSFYEAMVTLAKCHWRKKTEVTLVFALTCQSRQSSGLGVNLGATCSQRSW